MNPKTELLRIAAEVDRIATSHSTMRSFLHALENDPLVLRVQEAGSWGVGHRVHRILVRLDALDTHESVLYRTLESYCGDFGLSLVDFSVLGPEEISIEVSES